MEDQYGMADLRQYISSRPIFPPIPPPPDLLSAHRGLSAAAHPYDMLIFRSDSSAAAAAAAANTNAASSSAAAGHCFGGFEGGLNGGGGDGGAGRWPRQETLTLLEIRSRLDPKFKEANQKGPLWDEVSRIMCEEHGYQRSGKKCREKFENLYKYYKKTKEGKAGRQDGKHYRFFRQLEALYGETNTSPAEVQANKGGAFLAAARASDTSLSLSNCSDADTSSSEEESEMMKKRGGGWKAKIKEFIDGQMKKLMEKQEAWMEKMMSTIEDKERERMMREEEWRKQDAARIEREHKFWASERAWIEARDAALMEALHKFTAKDTAEEEEAEIWPECEINRLIQLTTAAMEGRFEQRGAAAEEMVWEEIASKMGCFGHERSAAVCKEKWDSINNYVLKCSKKRKDTSKICSNNYFQSHGGGGGGGMYCDSNNSNNGEGNGDHHHQNLSLNHDHGSSSPNPNTAAAAAISESCFRYFMGDAYGRMID